MRDFNPIGLKSSPFMKFHPILLLLASLLYPLHAQDTTADAGILNEKAAAKAFPSKRPYSPYADRNFPTRPFFGDTHLHTGFSMDAGAFGAR